jgi:RNA polymerase sigma-70 factor, ECF subfamily
MLGEDFPDVLVAAQAGDTDAFARLWRDTQPLLLRYLGVRAPGTADDVATETWLEVIPRLVDFRGDEAGFRGWVVTIARHKVIDHQRRTSRRPERLMEVVDVAGPQAPDTADVALERAATERAMRLIAELPADVAEMVALRVVVGLDVAHVARIVGRSPGAVRVAVHRGLRRLNALLVERSVTPAGRTTFQGRDD